MDGQTWQSVRTMFFWLSLNQQTSFNHFIRRHSDLFTFKSFVYILLKHRIPHLVEIINERNRCHPHSLPKTNQPCLGLRLISNPLTGPKPPSSAHVKRRFNKAFGPNQLHTIVLRQTHKQMIFELLQIRVFA